MYHIEDERDEYYLDEKQRFDAMMFKAQCMWRDYEEMVAGPHNRKKANMLLWQIGVLEANLKEMGAYSPA